MEEQLRVDAEARSGIDAGFWGAFAEGGADNVTIGTRQHETAGFAIADLLLIVDDPTLL